MSVQADSIAPSSPLWDGPTAAEVKHIDGFDIFDCTGISVRVQQRVVFQNEGGVDVGKVVRGPLPLLFPEDRPARILRRLTENDLRRLDENRSMEEEAMERAREEMLRNGSKVRPVRAHVRMDRRKVTIFFVAEERDDIRGIARTLGEILQVRVDLRQIGHRLAASFLPAIGTCGQKTCCSRWLRDFKSITLEAVRDQNLTQNLSKIHGHCGRLKCCLLYEVQTYRDFHAEAPRCGQGVCSGRCEKGKATVVELLPLKRAVVVADDEGRRYEIPLEEIEAEMKGRPWLKREDPPPSPPSPRRPPPA